VEVPMLRAERSTRITGFQPVPSGQHGLKTRDTGKVQNEATTPANAPSPYPLPVGEEKNCETKPRPVAHSDVQSEATGISTGQRSKRSHG
jgi:hypothetical protein